MVEDCWFCKQNRTIQTVAIASAVQFV